jgi:hypothetical protein
MSTIYNDVVSNSFWIIPLVVAIVQAIKMMGVATKFSPIISIGVGVGLGFLVNNDFTTAQSILSGVIYGLSASGLYSGITVTQKVADVKSGEIPLSKADKSLFSEKDIQEIQQKQQQQQQGQEQQSQNADKPSPIMKP